MKTIEFEGKSYKLDMDNIDVVEAMLIKTKTGHNLLPFQAALEECDPTALRALYWLMMKQKGVTMDYERVNFKIVQYVKAVQEATDDAETEEVPT